MLRPKTVFLLLALGCASIGAHADPRVDIAKKFPGATAEDLAPSQIPGMYELRRGGDVVYVTPDGRYALMGDLYDLRDNSNVTENRRRALRIALLEKVPDRQALVFSPKDPKYSIDVFTDIDCGYCRELHKHMTEYNDRGIQVEYLMFPRAGVGSDSFRKAVAAWCSKNPQETLTKAKAGEDPGNGSCVNPVEAQYQLGQRMGVNGTPTLVFPDGHVAPGYVTPEQLEQQLTLAEKRLAEAGK